jgi:hypothetical protein
LLVSSGFILIAGTVMVGWRAVIPVEEARKLTATFGSAGLVPPVRPEEDPTVILQQGRENPAAEAEERARANANPPATSDAEVLARFYSGRGMAAGAIGNLNQEIEDLFDATARLPRPSRAMSDLWLCGASRAPVCSARAVAIYDARLDWPYGDS